VCVCVVLTGKSAAAGFHLVNGRAAASSRVTSVGECPHVAATAARGGDYLLLRRDIFYARDETRQAAAGHTL